MDYGFEHVFGHVFTQEDICTGEIETGPAAAIRT